MALVTCMDSRGDVALFGFPSSRKFPLLRAHPIQMYVSPLGSKGGRVLYAVLPFAITPRQLESYFATKDEQSRYQIHNSGNLTLLVHQNNLGGYGDQWRLFFCPIPSFTLAVARAVRVAIDHHTAYHDIVEDFEGGLDRLEQAALRGEVKWITPVFDTQRNGDPMWIFHIDPMRLKLGIGPGTYEPSVRNAIYRLNRNISWSESSLPLGDRLNMVEPERASIDLGISQFIHVPFNTTEGFDPGDPPLPDDVVIDRSFKIEGENWTFKKSIPPSRWGQGWYYIIQSEHGVYSSLGQRQLMIMARSNWIVPPVIGWSPTLDDLYCLELGRRDSLPGTIRIRVFHKGRNWVRLYSAIPNPDGGHEVSLKNVVDERTYRAAKRARRVSAAAKVSKRKRLEQKKLEQERQERARLDRLAKLRIGMKRLRASSATQISEGEPTQERTRRSVDALRKLKKRRTGRG